jgi:prolyl-tRNA synthetase
MAGQGELPSRQEDFSGWYNQLVVKAELADYGPARGTMVIRPYGYALWENITRVMDNEIKAAGVQNAYFPLFIPKHLLETEAEHIEGFAPHLAVVTVGGGKQLDEPLIVRPTSETIMYPYFKKWVITGTAGSDQQWCNVVGCPVFPDDKFCGRRATAHHHEA